MDCVDGKHGAAAAMALRRPESTKGVAGDAALRGRWRTGDAVTLGTRRCSHGPSGGVLAIVVVSRGFWGNHGDDGEVSGGRRGFGVSQVKRGCATTATDTRKRPRVLGVRRARDGDLTTTARARLWQAVRVLTPGTHALRASRACALCPWRVSNVQ